MTYEIPRMKSSNESMRTLSALGWVTLVGLVAGATCYQIGSGLGYCEGYRQGSENTAKDARILVQRHATVLKDSAKNLENSALTNNSMTATTKAETIGMANGLDIGVRQLEQTASQITGAQLQ